MEAVAGQRPRRRSPPHRRAGHPGPAHHGLRLWRAVPGGRSLCRGHVLRPLRRPDAGRLRPRARFRLHRRLRAPELRPLPPHRAHWRKGGPRRPLESPQPGHGPAPPHERGRHRGNPHAVDPRGLQPRLQTQREDHGGRAQDRRDGGGLSRTAIPRRHLPVRRSGVAVRDHRRHGLPGHPRSGRRGAEPKLGRLQVRPLDLPRRPRSPHDRQQAGLAAPAGRCAGVAADPGSPLENPHRGPDAGGDLPAGQAPLPRGLSLRRAHQPRHPLPPPHPAAGAGGSPAR